MHGQIFSHSIPLSQVNDLRGHDAMRMSATTSPASTERCYAHARAGKRKPRRLFTVERPTEIEPAEPTESSDLAESSEPLQTIDAANMPPLFCSGGGWCEMNNLNVLTNKKRRVRRPTAKLSTEDDFAVSATAVNFLDLADVVHGDDRGNDHSKWLPRRVYDSRDYTPTRTRKSKSAARAPDKPTSLSDVCDQSLFDEVLSIIDKNEQTTEEDEKRVGLEAPTKNLFGSATFVNNSARIGVMNTWRHAQEMNLLDDDLNNLVQSMYTWLAHPLIPFEEFAPGGAKYKPSPRSLIRCHIVKAQ